MSKIKILETNKNLLSSAQAMFETILAMQTEADNQIKSIRSIEAKIVTIEKTKQEELAEQKRIEEENARRIKEEQEAAYIIRRATNGMKAEEAVDNLLNMFAHTKSNSELVRQVIRQKFI